MYANNIHSSTEVEEMKKIKAPGGPYTFSMGISMLPIGYIYFSQMNKPRLKFVPQDDITPLEVSLMFPLIIAGFNNSTYGNYDFWGYIESNGLMRHFEEIEDGT